MQPENETGEALEPEVMAPYTVASVLLAVFSVAIFGVFFLIAWLVGRKDERASAAVLSIVPKEETPEVTTTKAPEPKKEAPPVETTTKAPEEPAK